MAGDAVAPHRQQIGGAGGDGRAVGDEVPAREPGIEAGYFTAPAAMPRMM